MNSVVEQHPSECRLDAVLHFYEMAHVLAAYSSKREEVLVVHHRIQHLHAVHARSAVDRQEVRNT